MVGDEYIYLYHHPKFHSLIPIPFPDDACEHDIVCNVVYSESRAGCGVLGIVCEFELGHCHCYLNFCDFLC